MHDTIKLPFARTALAAAMLAAMLSPGEAVAGAATVELSALNGDNGFIMNGVNPIDYSGTSVSGAGDVNGDGIDDLIVGAPFAGLSYVVFGSRTDFGVSFELSSLNGANGASL